MARVIIINLKIENNCKNKCNPLTQKELKQFQKLKMKSKFCKSDNKNNIELTTYIFCIKDIQINTDFFFIKMWTFNS